MTGPRCDFCSSEDPVWIYPAEDFPIGAILDTADLEAGGTIQVTHSAHYSTGGWVACAPCAQHIDLGSYDQLGARAIASHLIRHPEWDPNDPALEAFIRSTHEGFRVHRSGPKAGFG